METSGRLSQAKICQNRKNSRKTPLVVKTKKIENRFVFSVVIHGVFEPKSTIIIGCSRLQKAKTISVPNRLTVKNCNRFCFLVFGNRLFRFLAFFRLEWKKKSVSPANRRIEIGYFFGSEISLVPGRSARWGLSGVLEYDSLPREKCFDTILRTHPAGI